MNRCSLKHFSIFAFFLFSFIQTVSCQTFSEWRGEGRTGVYNETALLRKWPEKGPEMLWSVTGIPKGNSSVAIGDRKLYVTGTKDSVEFLIAFDRKGNKLWETPYGRAWTKLFPESRCTPTIDEDRIYVTSGVLDAACIDAVTGKIIWSVKVNEKFEGAFGFYGKAESPLVWGNMVFFTPCGNKTTMVALDKFTGETIWTSESLKEVSRYVSPLLIDRNGTNLIVGMTEHYIIGVSAKDGKILWKFDYGAYAVKNENEHANTPIFWDGSIFVSSGYEHPSVMLKLSDDGLSVSLQWSEKVMDTHHGGNVRVGAYIFGSNFESNSKGRWACLDWYTGKTMYKTDWINKGPIIAAEDMLYCYEEKTGTMALVKATPEEFEVVSSFKIPLGTGPHWSHPVISNGILFVRHMDALMAFDINRSCECQD
jgi:outer membrane protein assembly factor BamB